MSRTLLSHIKRIGFERARKFLSQPYPFFHRGRELLTIATLILVFAFLFEYLFEPFLVYRPEHRYSYWIICLLHSANAVIIYLIYASVTNPFVDVENWKLYNEIVFFLVLFFLIGSGQFFLREIIYKNPENVSLQYLLEEIRNTYLVGTVLIFIISVISLNFLTKKNQKKANLMKIPSNKTELKSETIPIKAHLTSDHFELQPSELLCIKSDGNYLEFYLKNGEKPQKKIKRMTLKSAEDQLSGFPFIVKTHRAYLVNIRQIEDVSGNAQGYQLNLKNLDFKVPVSRSHIDSFNQKFD